MIKKLIIILFFIFSALIVNAQVEIIYFDVVRRGDVYFMWAVKSKKKELTYILQSSYDKINFVDILNYKTESKKYNISFSNDFIYFRLKIMITKDCYIYSDIIYVKSDDPIKIYPDPYGTNTIYIDVIEDGKCYIYNKNNDIMVIQTINEGYNQVCFNLLSGEYFVKVFTENYYSEIKIYAK